MAKTGSIEERLIREYGDLHAIIPDMASRLGQEATARALHVRQAWLSKWLRKHGYRKVTKYERKENK